MNTIKLGLVDDHQLFRDALVEMLRSDKETHILFSVNDGAEAIDQLQQKKIPDLLILDLNMPNINGYATIDWVNQNKIPTKIIILTMYDSEITLIRLLKQGVRGFLKKDITASEFKLALKTVHERGYYYSPNIAGKIVNLFSNQKYHLIQNLESVLLNDIEIEFLKYVSTDLTYKEIAAEMDMNPRTIDNYRDALFTKLDVKSRVGLAMYAFKHGLIDF